MYEVKLPKLKTVKEEGDITWYRLKYRLGENQGIISFSEKHERLFRHIAFKSGKADLFLETVRVIGESSKTEKNCVENYQRII